MRIPIFIFTLFVVTASALLAGGPTPTPAPDEPTYSEQLRQKLTAILKDQIGDIVDERAREHSQAPQAPEQREKMIESLMKVALMKYGPSLLSPEEEAKKILAEGPDDTANIKAIEADMESWKNAKREMPPFLQKLMEQVNSRVVKSGLRLEFACRISGVLTRDMELVPKAHSEQPGQ